MINFTLEDGVLSFDGTAVLADDIRKIDVDDYDKDFCVLIITPTCEETIGKFDNPEEAEMFKEVLVSMWRGHMREKRNDQYFADKTAYNLVEAPQPAAAERG